MVNYSKAWYNNVKAINLKEYDLFSYGNSIQYC